MTRKLLLLFAFICSIQILQGQTSLAGVVSDLETSETLIAANVALYRNGVFQTGTQTDFDGNYNISNLFHTIAHKSYNTSTPHCNEGKVRCLL